VDTPSRRYRAFISYSHAADGKLAPALQTGLERFAKPWYRRRALRVFRDKTGLAVTPELWGSIRRALEASEYFILLASPAAAQSMWVQQEAEFWLQHRSVDTLLIVLTDGVIAWDPAKGDFDWDRTDALPRLPGQRFSAEPNYLDLRWARTDTDLSVRRPRFLDAVASLSATLRHVPLDDLIGEDVAHYRTTRRLLKGAVATLVLLTVSALYGAYLANQARNLAGRLEAERIGRIVADQRAAEEQARKAETQRLADAERERNAEASRHLASVAAGLTATNLELSTLLAMEAVQTSPTREAEAILRQLLVRPAPPVIFHGPDGPGVRHAAFSTDGRRLLAVFDDGSVRIWPAGSPNAPIVLRPETSDRDDGTTAMFSPDGATVLTVPFLSDHRTYLEESGLSAAARIWDAVSGRLRIELKHPHATDADFGPDGKRVVTAGDDRAVVIWDADSGTRLAEHRDHEREVVHVRFSRDGKWLASAGKDNTVRIRAGHDGKTMTVLRVPGKSYLDAAVFSPDNRWLLTISRDDPPRLWDWQGAPGSSMAALSGPAEPFYPAGFSPDSSMLATVGGNAAQVWQVSTGRILHELVHEESVNDAAFSPNGRWIVTAVVDGSAGVWEASTGKRLLTLGGYDRSRTTAAFSPDGSRIATGTAFGQVLVHACEACGSVEELMSVARSRVSRPLTAEERSKYRAAPQPR
jgi:WD40 repeat protein